MEFSNQYPHVSASLTLLGVCSNPVLSHIVRDSSSTQHCEPNLHPLSGVHAVPVISPDPIANPSELRPTMFSSLVSSPQASGMLMETALPHAEEQRQEEQTSLDPASIEQPTENN